MSYQERNHYLTIAQDRVMIERYVRQEEGSQLKEHYDIGAELHMASLHRLSLTIQEIYFKVRLAGVRAG